METVFGQSVIIWYSLLQLVNAFRDFANKLAVSLLANESSALHSLDLSNNLIEDRGKLSWQTLKVVVLVILSTCSVWHSGDIHVCSDHDFPLIFFGGCHKVQTVGCLSSLVTHGLFLNPDRNNTLLGYCCMNNGATLQLFWYPHYVLTLHTECPWIYLLARPWKGSSFWHCDCMN